MTMKFRKPNVRFLVLILVTAVLLAAVGLFCYRGDWRYRVALRFRTYPPLQLTEAPPTAGEPLPFVELLSDARTVQSDSLILVNPNHPLPAGYEPALIETDGLLISDRALSAFRKLNEMITEATGTRLYIRSAYRSAEEQATEAAQNGEYAAKPGESEHETGLALDVCVAGYGGMSFLKTKAGRLTCDRCAEYGFIVRYPSGKENVTGVPYEPWHLRYVGKIHAGLMAESGLSLEEYLHALTPEVWYRTADGAWILRTASEEIVLPESEWSRCEISPDHLGYQIVTIE